MKFGRNEDIYILWAVRHGGSNREIAFDLGRSEMSVAQRIKDLRKIYKLPDRRKINCGRKARKNGDAG